MTAYTSPRNPRNLAQPVIEHLPGLPGKALTPQQQLEAIQRVEQQAQQRVKLGLQLFKAAEAHTASHRQILEQIQAEREKFRDELTQDVSKTLHAYDQWIGQMDESYTQAMLTLEQRINELDAKVNTSAAKLQAMLDQSQKLLAQAEAMLEEKAVLGQPAAKPSSQPEQAQPQASLPQQPEISVEITHHFRPETSSAVEADAAPIETPSSPLSAPPTNESRKVSYADLLTRIHAGRESLKKDG